MEVCPNVTNFVSLFPTPMFLLLLTLFQPADTLKQDQWLFWLTPTSLLHSYHPALEAGFEFQPKERRAFTLHFGLDLGSSENEPYRNQKTKYLRLGTKFYTSSKPTAPYFMPELSAFHIGHEGKYVTADAALSPLPQNAKATFTDWVLKAGGILGLKAPWGALRIDIFAGGGLRLGTSEYKVLHVGGAPYAVPDKHNWGKLNRDVTLTKQSGHLKIPTTAYLSLGLRLGFPFKSTAVP